MKSRRLRRRALEEAPFAGDLMASQRVAETRLRPPGAFELLLAHFAIAFELLDAARIGTGELGEARHQIENIKTCQMCLVTRGKARRVIEAAHSLRRRIEVNEKVFERHGVPSAAFPMR